MRDDFDYYIFHNSDFILQYFISQWLKKNKLLFLNEKQ